MASNIYLIRHGETDWALLGRHTSRTDLPLTAHGEQEARALAPGLSGVEFSLLLSSPARRARRTCELAVPARPASIDPDLAEWDYGDYEGLRSAEILQKRPGWNLFRDGCPGGETPAQVSARADRLLARLRTQEGTIAAFTHGHFGRVLAARWIALPVLEAQRFLLSTASLSVLGFERPGAATPVIALWNSRPSAS
jgi:broad specificity phosphatase PhoE